MIDLARWYAAWIADTARDTFNALPGPKPVKIALVVLCLAIPGPQDELAILALTALCRAYRRRKAGK